MNSKVKTDWRKPQKWRQSKKWRQIKQLRQSQQWACPQIEEDIKKHKYKKEGVQRNYDDLKRGKKLNLKDGDNINNEYYLEMSSSKQICSMV